MTVPNVVKNEPGRIVFISAGFILLAIGIWIRLKPVPLEVQSEAILRGLIAGNTRLLVDRMLPHERKAYRLDENRMQQLWASLIHPYIRDYELVGSVERHLSASDGSEASARLRMSNASGRTISFALNTFSTSSGGCYSLHDLLLATWHLRYLDEKRPSFETIMQARITGIEADRTKLEELGIKGVYPIDDPLRFYTWDDLKYKYQHALQHRLTQVDQSS